VAPATVIAVASGKGGVGKTWMSCTLAACFAKMGRRTLLVDGDLGLANVDVQLGIAPETDLAAVIAGWVELEDAVTPINGGAGAPLGFDVLPGRSGSGALAGLPAEEASRLAASLTALALQYDTVLVDLGAGIEDNVMRLARACDRCLIVANDEPTSMTDAYAFIKVLRGYAPSVQPWISINMADTRVAGRRTYEALARASQTFLGFRPPMAGIVLRDPKVREAIRQQKTIISIDPQSQAAIDVSQIAESLIRGGAESVAQSA
jgi:flagellar biosynthesis protein FlhG